MTAARSSLTATATRTIDFGQEWDCTHCGGEGTCDAGADHVVGLPGRVAPVSRVRQVEKRADQTIF